MNQMDIIEQQKSLDTLGSANLLQLIAVANKMAIDLSKYALAAREAGAVIEDTEQLLKQWDEMYKSTNLVWQQQLDEDYCELPPGLAQL